MHIPDLIVHVSLRSHIHDESNDNNNDNDDGHRCDLIQRDQGMHQRLKER